MNSVQLVEQLDVAPTDKLISRDIVALFTRMPISVALDLLSPLFPESTVKMFEFVLRSTYFSYKGLFFEGIAMGSLLSPVIANFFMEFFEQSAMEQASLKPLFYCRYVDETLLVWQHGQVALEEFVGTLYSTYDSIKFTVGQEQYGKVAFLLIRSLDGKLGRNV